MIFGIKAKLVILTHNVLYRYTHASQVGSNELHLLRYIYLSNFFG